jgi:hypothetical protein
MTKNAFLIALSESPQVHFGRVDYLEQSTTQRVFSCIWALESQVNAGGFQQYFASWDGETAADAPWALRTLGAMAMASIVARANGLFPNGQPPRNTEERRQQLGAVANDQLAKLDTEFLAYPDNLTDLLYAFVQANPAEFGPTPI